MTNLDCLDLIYYSNRENQKRCMMNKNEELEFNKFISKVNENT